VRVVSLVPSVTETLLAWGVRPVGVTRFCAAPGVPVVGGTKNPDLGAIRRLCPDLVVACVEENRREDAERLAEWGVRLLALDVRSVDDVAPELARLAEAVGVGARAEASLAEVPAARGLGQRRRAFVPVWRRPWVTMNADCYGSSVLERLGLDNVFADAAERYPRVDPEEVAARSPDLVVAPDEPYPFGPRHAAELVRFGQVVFVDGRDLFWWGVRTPSALARLGSVLGQLA
jgi:ABC-type Fe3+-hydroxamate transport system substrate-binding protein